MPIPEKIDGKLPTYAWPGSYPLYYLLSDGEICCPACVNGENRSDAYTEEDADKDPAWRIVGCAVHWEGEPLVCYHCNNEIAPALRRPERG